MRCPQCGQVLPESANFCMGCGQRLVPMTSTGNPLPNAQPPANSSSAWAKWLGVGVGLLLLLGLAFWVGTQSGLLTQARIKKPEAPSVLEAQVPKVEAPSVLEAQAPKVEGPSVLETQTPKQPPPHVLDWLEHLRRTEEQRQRRDRNLAPVLSMLAQAMVLRAQVASGAAEGDLDKATATYEREREKLRQSYQQRRREWVDLLQFFRSKQPPPECQVLADTYYSGLSEYINIVTQIENDLIEGDLGGLTGLLGSAQAGLDAKFARADEELAKVCQQYGIPKYFSVGSPSPDLLRSLGGGMPLGL